jgi:hypothetical protein
MRMRRAPSLPLGVALVLLLAGLAAMPATAAGAQQPAVSSNWAG